MSQEKPEQQAKENYHDDNLPNPSFSIERTPNDQLPPAKGPSPVSTLILSPLVGFFIIILLTLLGSLLLYFRINLSSNGVPEKQPNIPANVVNPSRP